MEVIPVNKENISMKVVGNWGQPVFSLDKNETEIPPAPTMEADIYAGSDSGFPQIFTAGFHNTSLINYTFGTAGAQDATAMVVNNAYPPVVGSLFAYGDGSAFIQYNADTDQYNFPGYQTPTFLGSQDVTVSEQTYVNPLSQSLLSDQNLLGQQGILGWDSFVPSANRTSPDRPSSTVVSDLSMITAENNTCGTGEKDLGDYAKCLTKFVICYFSNDEDVLKEGSIETQANGQNEWVNTGRTNRIVLTSRALWSMEKGQGIPDDDSCPCHAYPKKQETDPTTGITTLVDDPCYHAINPAFALNLELSCEMLDRPVLVSTNDEIIKIARAFNCTHDIIEINLPADANGDAKTASYLYAHFQDLNVDARKRGGTGGGGGVDGYDPECIIICDKDGNEKEGYVLFKEEECVGGASTVGGGGGGEEEEEVVVTASCAACSDGAWFTNFASEDACKFHYCSTEIDTTCCDETAGVTCSCQYDGQGSGYNTSQYWCVCSDGTVWGREGEGTYYDPTRSGNGFSTDDCDGMCSSAHDPNVLGGY
jgi:hypothetical protein